MSFFDDYLLDKCERRPKYWGIGGDLYENLMEGIKNGSLEICPTEISFNSLDETYTAEIKVWSNWEIGKKEEKEKMKVQEWMVYNPIKIIINGPATIFFWPDKTKTVVKCAEDDNFDLYHAYCVAVTKRIMGTNSHIKSILKHAEIHDQTLKETEDFFKDLFTKTSKEG